MDERIDHLKYDLRNEFDLEKLTLAQNYSLLLSKIKKLANDEYITNDFLDAKFNLNSLKNHDDDDIVHQHVLSEAEYSRFISDVWIGIILTILILSIVFFICSCFLYHKFQQWKNTYRTNNASDPCDGIRRYDIDVESLPSYTLVSGLPTYDDALEQFRKAGIIIQPPSVIKIFEDFNCKSSTTNITNDNNDGDNISISSCICGGQQGTGSATTLPGTTISTSPMFSTSVIELNPDQLKILSQKRLSLQIALNSSVRRSSRGRIDLCREVNRTNLLRSHDLPQIHRSTSSLSNERAFLSQRLKNLQHRGSLY